MSILTTFRIAAVAVLMSASMVAGCGAEAGTVGFVKRAEGFRATVYRDAAGRKTIGYGFTSDRMVGRGRLSEAEAAAELKRICRSITLRLRAELGGKRLSASEETAVVSFIYNVGWANFKASTMCRLLKSGKRGEAVASEFSKWIYVTKGGRKVVSKGLKARREKERRKFLA